MRLFGFIFTALTLLACTVMAEDIPWHEPDAQYRLVVENDRPNDGGFLDLGQYFVPGSLDKGVVVKDPTGKALYFHFDKTRKSFFIGRDKTAKKACIYFGFNRDALFSSWPSHCGPVPELRRLIRVTVNANIRNRGRNDGKGWEQRQIELIKKKRKEAEEKLGEKQKKLDEKKAQLAPKEKTPARRVSSPAENVDAELQKEIAELEQEIQRDRERAKKREELWEEAIERWRKRRERMAKDEKLELLRQFERNRGVLEEKAMEEVRHTDAMYLPRENNALICFKGKLVVPEDGAYEFAINSIDASLLTIDGEYALGWPGEHPRSDDWEETVELDLKAGLHDFAFYDYKRHGERYAAAAWRRKGDASFEILQRTNFAYQWPVSINSCQDKQGNSYPLVKYIHRGFFLLGKPRVDWMQCDIVPLDASNLKYGWKVGDQKYGMRKRMSFFIPKQHTPKVSLDLSENNLKPIYISVPAIETERLDPNLFLDVFAPSFLYDDESLELSASCISELYDDIDVMLKTDVNAVTPLIPRGVEWMSLKGRGTDDKDKYAPGFYEKRRYQLKGNEVPSGLQVTFTLEVPPTVIATKTVRFVSLQDVGTLQPGKRGLVDNRGVPAVVMLHRSRLDEIRRWSFSSSIVDKFNGVSNVMVVSDDFGPGDKRFSLEIAKALKAKGVSTTFLAWKDTKEGVSMQAVLPELLAAIKNSKADSLLVIPSSYDRDKGVPSRMQRRCLGALIQIARENDSIRRITLCSALPNLFADDSDKKMVDMIAGLGRETGSQTFNLNLFVRRLPDWQKAYRLRPDVASEVDSFPIHLTEQIAKRLADLVK